MIFRDLLQEAYTAMRHNRRRTALTMLGMAWGIATVVMLLAYGDGFGQACANQLRRRRSRPGDKWHQDQVFVKFNGTAHCLWLGGRGASAPGLVPAERRVCR